MLSNEQVQRIGELTHAKHIAGMGMASAKETYERSRNDLQVYLNSLTEPAKRGRPAGSKTGVRNLGLPSAEQASLTGLPDENEVGS